MRSHGITKSTLGRLPLYLEFLNSLTGDRGPYITAYRIAEATGLTETQVRKDLAAVSVAGRPKVGYSTEMLKAELEEFLGRNNELVGAVVVGVGKLGRALLEYEGFAGYGLEVVAGFDKSAEAMPGGKPVYRMENLRGFCAERGISLGIIAVPDAAAQSVCDEMVKSGITAILNFAPVPLTAPGHVLVKNENIAVSLAMLADHSKIEKI